MAVLPYIDDETASAEALVLFAHADGLLGRVSNAIRMAAHSPRVAQPLLGFMLAAIRHEISGVLDMRTKALVILKTSTLNGCDYCVGHNTALGRGLGFAEDEIAAISGDYRGSHYFSGAEKAAIAWAECLTERTYRRDAHATDELKQHFTPAQIVELTMVSGFFNFWNRFTDALQLDIEDNEQVGKIQKSKTIDPDKYIKFMQDCWWGINENRNAGNEPR